MGQIQIYNAGLASWSRWGSGTFKLALMTSGSFNRDHAHVSDVIGGGARCSVSGYADIAPDTPVLTVDNATDRDVATVATDPSWGSLPSGQTVTAMLIYEFITNDAGSLPMGWLTLAATATDAIDPFVVTFADLVIGYLTAGSGS